jgi:L-2-hydroxyglutarate oxidase LhgO
LRLKNWEKFSVESEQANVIVIGAGVVGCAVAYELASRGLNPVVLEKGPRIAEGTTSRNSGVVHSGLYYPPKSIKAESCIRGNALLYEWCARYGVPYAKPGKWIIGSRDETDALNEIYLNARASGAKGVDWIPPQTLAAASSEIKAEIGLHSPETGIVDPFEYSRSFQVQAEALGAMFLMNSEVTSVLRHQNGFEVETSRGKLKTDAIVNAAGLYADEISRKAGVDKYKIHPCRGDYFRLSTPKKYKRLIYPVKKKGAPGLGIHLTIGLDGGARLGPDTQYVTSKEDFTITDDAMQIKRDAFFASVSKYLRGIKVENLHYDSCGLRPKLRASNEPEEKDFVIAKDLPGFINLVGIESPGLTAARDLAQRVARLF